MRRGRRKGTNRDKVFGCDLQEHLTSTGQDIPPVLRSCSEFIEEYGVVDGIYRLSGVSSNTQKLRSEFDTEGTPDLYKDVYLQDIHCVSSLCKAYFRELPNPLLTYELYDRFADAVAVQLEDERLVKIQEVLKDLPAPHYRTLEYLMQHLVKMSTYASQTNMHSRNLAIVWAPNLLRSKDIESTGFNGTAAFMEVRVQSIVVEFILTHVAELFPGPGLAKERRKSLPSPTLLSNQEELFFKSLPLHCSGNLSPGDGPPPMRPYHAIIDGTDKRKSSLKGRKWRSIFNLGGRLHDPRKKSKYCPKDKEKTSLRPAKSMDSLSSGPYAVEKSKHPPALLLSSGHSEGVAAVGGGVSSGYAVTYRRTGGAQVSMVSGGTPGTYSRLDSGGGASGAEGPQITSRSPGMTSKADRRAGIHISGPFSVTVPLHITSGLALGVLHGGWAEREQTLQADAGEDHTDAGEDEDVKGAEPEKMSSDAGKTDNDVKESKGDVDCQVDCGKMTTQIKKEKDTLEEGDAPSTEGAEKADQQNIKRNVDDDLPENNEETVENDYMDMRGHLQQDLLISADHREIDEFSEQDVQEAFGFLDLMDSCASNQEFSVEPPCHEEEEEEEEDEEEKVESTSSPALSSPVQNLSNDTSSPPFTHRPLSGKSHSLPYKSWPFMPALSLSSDEDYSPDDDDVSDKGSEYEDMFCQSLPSSHDFHGLSWSGTQTTTVTSVSCDEDETHITHSPKNSKDLQFISQSEDTILTAVTLTGDSVRAAGTSKQFSNEERLSGDSKTDDVKNDIHTMMGEDHLESTDSDEDTYFGPDPISSSPEPNQKDTADSNVQEPNQTEPNQIEPIQTDLNQTAPNQTEPNQVDLNQTAPNQTEPNQTEPNQTEPNQKEPNQKEPNQKEPNQKEPNHKEPNHKEPNHKEPNHKEPNHKEPNHKEPNHKEPKQTDTADSSVQELNQKELNQKEPNQKEPNQTELKQTDTADSSVQELNQKEPNQKEPNHKEPKQTDTADSSVQEPNQTEPNQTEPNQKEPNQKEPNQKEPNQKEPNQKEPKQTDTADSSVQELNQKELNQKELNQKEPNQKEPNQKELKQTDTADSSVQELNQKELNQKELNQKEPNQKETNQKELKQTDTADSSVQELNQKEPNQKEPNQKELKQTDTADSSVQELNQKEPNQKEPNQTEPNHKEPNQKELKQTDTADSSVQEPNQTEPNQTEPNQKEPNQKEPNQKEPNQKEPNQKEPKQTDTADSSVQELNQKEPNQKEPNQKEPNQKEPNQTEPNQTEPNQTEPNQTEPNQTEPNQREPNQREPNQREPNQREPNQREPNQREPNQREPNQREPNQTEPNQTEPNQTEPNQTEPNQTEPNQTEPNQTEPNQTEPNQTEPNQRDTANINVHKPIQEQSTGLEVQQVLKTEVYTAIEIIITDEDTDATSWTAQDEVKIGPPPEKENYEEKNKGDEKIREPAEDETEEESIELDENILELKTFEHNENWRKNEENPEGDVQECVTNINETVEAEGQSEEVEDHVRDESEEKTQQERDEMKKSSEEINIDQENNYRNVGGIEKDTNVNTDRDHESCAHMENISCVKITEETAEDACRDDHERSTFIHLPNEVSCGKTKDVETNEQENEKSHVISDEELLQKAEHSHVPEETSAPKQMTSQVKSVPIVPPKPQNSKLTALTLRKQFEHRDAERQQRYSQFMDTDGQHDDKEQQQHRDECVKQEQTEGQPRDVYLKQDITEQQRFDWDEHRDSTKQRENTTQHRATLSETSVSEMGQEDGKKAQGTGDAGIDLRKDPQRDGEREMKRNSAMSICFDEAVARATVKRSRESSDRLSGAQWERESRRDGFKQKEKEEEGKTD